MLKITLDKERYLKIRNSPWFQDALELSDEIVIIAHNQLPNEQPQATLINEQAQVNLPIEGLVEADRSNNSQASHAIWWNLHHILEPYDQFIAIFLALSLGIFTEFAVNTIEPTFIAWVGLIFFLLALALGMIAAVDFFRIQHATLKT